jgi:hypothetical protein
VRGRIAPVRLAGLKRCSVILQRCFAILQRFVETLQRCLVVSQRCTKILFSCFVSNHAFLLILQRYCVALQRCPGVFQPSLEASLTCLASKHPRFGPSQRCKMAKQVCSVAKQRCLGILHGWEESSFTRSAPRFPPHSLVPKLHLGTPPPLSSKLRFPSVSYSSPIYHEDKSIRHLKSV